MSQVFTEIGIDPDNNRYVFGVSTEIESKNGTEIRKVGFMKMQLKGFYFRIWLFKIVVGFGIPSGFVVKRKNRNNLKILIGLSGLSDNIT